MDFSSKLFLKQNLYRWFKKQETKEHRLTYLFLELSRKCNLNCLHCGSDCKNDSNFPELTRESWKKIISYVKNEFSSKVNLVITGGEPLMHPDLIAIGKHIKSQKMNWGMVTNGILLSQNYLSQLEDTGISSITISLDGIGESHNYLRQSGKAFEKTKQAIEQIGKSSITFKDVVTCVYPENIKQLDDIAALLINLGITSWRLFRIFPSGRAKLNTRVQLSYEQTWEMISWIKKKQENIQAQRIKH